ncbi:exported hypothetical protein [Novosphingobium sp. KN65.2]|nr:exported hypothetical protein [Novosphingobium sp. KN65.2]
MSSSEIFHRPGVAGTGFTATGACVLVATAATGAFAAPSPVVAGASCASSEVAPKSVRMQAEMPSRALVLLMIMGMTVADNGQTGD